MAKLESFIGKYFVVYGIDFEKFCAKYEIEPFVGVCSECGNDLIVDRPFRTGNRAGLISMPCECGNSCVPFTVAVPFEAFYGSSTLFGCNDEE